MKKNYRNLKAIDGLSFSVGKGEIFGLLGPNGAGKSSTVRCLITISKISSGDAQIWGLDVARDPDKVRKICGYVPQTLSVIAELTGYENLLMAAKMNGVPSSKIKSIVNDLLELMKLSDRKNDLVKKYSGGMMRRLEIAQAFVHRPKVLFLDEPTIGLDPKGKRVVWDHLRNLRNEYQTTIFITTHDMNEANHLCDRIAIINRGQIVVIGDPEELKKQVGGDVIMVKTRSLKNFNRDALADLGAASIDMGEEELTIVTNEGEKAIPKIIQILAKNDISVESISVSKPTLDDVFLKTVGSRIDEEESGDWRSIRSVRRTVSTMG
ncbi:MAG: ATP-binding cassette domain-containing protein [Thaumarchaeota archaeon]|nr:ATP-binding cassette domain-containing protein [Nitrososphaerota archaeon]